MTTSEKYQVPTQNEIEAISRELMEESRRETGDLMMRAAHMIARLELAWRRQHKPRD